MKNIEDKIDQLHDKVSRIQEKTNHIKLTTDKRIRDLDDRVFSQEIRISKIESGSCNKKREKTWKIGCIERLFWIAFVVGFIGFVLVSK